MSENKDKTILQKIVILPLGIYYALKNEKSLTGKNSQKYPGIIYAYWVLSLQIPLKMT